MPNENGPEDILKNALHQSPISIPSGEVRGEGEPFIRVVPKEEALRGLGGELPGGPTVLGATVINPADEKERWIKCEECGFETSADLANCDCDDCGARAWSKPYEA